MTSYDEINNTKAIYSNISIPDIRTHYTLWSEEGLHQWYVYKCKEKHPLDNFGSYFRTSTWIMMSPGLHNQEGQKNNNWMPGMRHRTLEAINRKITEIKEKIKEKNKKEDEDISPLWYEASEDNFDEKVKEVNLSLSIGSIISKVKDILQASQGDILSMAKVVTNLKLECTFNFSKSQEQKKVVKSAMDVDGVEVFILFDYNHKISDSNHKIKRVFGFSKKKIHMKANYYIFKPRNKAARDICKNLLNCKISELLHNARKL